LRTLFSDGNETRAKEMGERRVKNKCRRDGRLLLLKKCKEEGEAKATSFCNIQRHRGRCGDRDWVKKEAKGHAEIVFTQRRREGGARSRERGMSGSLHNKIKTREPSGKGEMEQRCPRCHGKLRGSEVVGLIEGRSVDEGQTKKRISTNSWMKGNPPGLSTGGIKRWGVGFKKTLKCQGRVRAVRSTERKE